MEQAYIEDSMEELLEYQKNGDLEVRNRLVLSYLYIVRSAAVQLRGAAANSGQEEDLLNQGVLALMECMERFDASKGAKFETYAYIRVRGAMIDYIRKQDFIPHRTRNMGKKINEAYMQLANETMREPTLEELSEYLKLDAGKLNQYMKDINNSAVLSFEGMLNEVTGMAVKQELPMTDMDLKPEESFMKQEIQTILADGIDSLSDKEKAVISLYYYEEIKYAGIAKIMGIGESRVCQIHTKAILKLKTIMEEYMRG